VNVEVETRSAEQQSGVVPPQDLKARTKAFAVDIVRLVQELRREAEQLVAIVVASIRTARMGRRTGHSNPQSAIRNPQCS
jgi:hypothetical protein